MAGGSDAAEAVKPFDWREIEDEDELSFGSEYESDGNLGADASAPRSDQAVDTVAQSTAADDQLESVPSKSAVADEDVDDFPSMKATRGDITKSGYPTATNAPRQQTKPTISSQRARKVPRTPVKWTPPPSKPSHNGKSGDPLGGGVRGKSQSNRGTGVSVPGVHKKVFNPAARGQPQMMAPRPHMATFATFPSIMSSFRGRAVQHEAQPIERGQFMTKRTNIPMQGSQGNHDTSTEMASALGQLKGGAVRNVLQSHMAMNPAAPPFTPRPPPRPPQQNLRPPPQPQPQPPQMQPPAHQPLQHFQPPQVTAAQVPFGVPKPKTYHRPVAEASTWIRGVSDRVDFKPTPKATPSSTWVNPEILSSAAPQAAAAHASIAPAAVAPAPNSTVNKQALDSAAAEELRQKDAMIAHLQEQLQQQHATKRRHPDEDIEDVSVPQTLPKKTPRVGEGNRASHMAERGMAGKKGPEGRSKAHISSRVQILPRSSDEKAAVREAPPTVNCSASPPTENRSQEKDPHGRDRGYHVSRRAPDRATQSRRSGGDRRLNQETHLRSERREGLTDAEKSRMQRFSAGKAL